MVPEKTVAYWHAVHHTPNIVEGIGDNQWITTSDGGQYSKVVHNEFIESASFFHNRVGTLRKLDTVGVDPALIEWNLKACIILELHSQVLIRQSNSWTRYVMNPLGGLVLAGDNIDEFIRSYNPQSSVEMIAVEGMIKSVVKTVGDLKAFEAGVWKLRDELIREKYEIRARIAQRIGKPLPLGDDGCPIVTVIDENSPAARCGLRLGDVLLEYDGQSLAEEAHDKDVLAPAIDRATAKKAVAILVLRNGFQTRLDAPGGIKLGIRFVVSPATRPMAWVRIAPPYRTGVQAWLTPYPFRKPGQLTP